MAGPAAEQPAAKKAAPAAARPAAAAAAAAAASHHHAAGSAEPPAPPSNILFAVDLPEEASTATLTAIMQPYYGFKEVRTITTKKGLAFIEFENELQSSLAMQSLAGYRFPVSQQPLRLAFAKR